MQELLQHDVQVEAFGGETLAVEVSATKQTNLDKLLEAIALQAELLDLVADPERNAEGTVIEARLDRGRGPVATVVVQRGSHVRLIRDNVVVHEGKLSTLKRFKDEVAVVQAGQECGVAFENYQDMRVGDVIECYNVQEVRRTL